MFQGDLSGHMSLPLRFKIPKVQMLAEQRGLSSPFRTNFARMSEVSRSVYLGIKGVLSMGSLAEVFGSIIRSVSVDVVDLFFRQGTVNHKPNHDMFVDSKPTPFARRSLDHPVAVSAQVSSPSVVFPEQFTVRKLQPWGYKIHSFKFNKFRLWFHATSFITGGA